MFSKNADVIPLRKQSTVTTAFNMMLSTIGVPKTKFSDQGIEFKNATFQKLLDKHNITVIFALSHAPFVEVFNKTIKYKSIKYMELHNTTNWSDFLQPVLTA